MTTRTPRPEDLLTARDIADMWGWPINRAESVFKAIARDGHLVRIDGFRRAFIERGVLEARIKRG